MGHHPLTADDLWSIPRVGSPVPSPDGKHLVVPLTTYSMEGNEGSTRLWLLPADATEAGSGGPADPARPLTATALSSSQPAWSPDGTQLAFVRKLGGAKGAKGKPSHMKHPDRPQLFLLSLAGGEPERLTDLPLGVADPQWFPDGRTIAFLSPVYRDASTIERTARRAQKREEDPVKAAVTEDRVYRYWDRWLTDGAVSHIFALDVATREIVDLTPDSKRWFDPDDPTGQYEIAPDGKQIAFAACRTRRPWSRLHWGIFTVPVPGRIRAGTRPARTKALTAHATAEALRPVYSPDGRWILFGMTRDPDFYADRVRIVAHDRRTGRQTVLTEGWDASATRWFFGEKPGTLYILAEVEARTAVFSLDLRAALRKPGGVAPREVLRGGTLRAPRIAGGTLFASLSTLRDPPEVIACRPDGKGLRRLTAFTRSAMKEILLSEVEEEVFEGAQGDPVQMFLLYPPGARRPRKGGRPRRHTPLVHLIHGGPHGTFGDEWHWRWNAQAFAAPGYTVALVNFHGSTGFGETFTASILGRWGDQPYADILKATDRLVERGIADPKRMAVAGGSYGGYLVSWIASQTDRFAAIVNHAGVCDFQTQYASDITQGRARSMGGEPWRNQEGMDRYNPMRHAGGFRSPMLVVHGEKDYRVPHAQGLEIYNVYKAMGLPARLVCYPDENHWILKPRNSRHWYGEVLGWLGRWLGTGRAREGGR